MKTAPIPTNDRERLDALLSYRILDSEPEKDFDDITRLASEICGTQISVITLLDENRQWFKSTIGLDLRETGRDISFCGHAINRPDENFIVENAIEDERFFDNPLVTEGIKIRTYAGVPLIDPDGHALGTLCVIDNRPKKLEAYQVKALEKLANQVSKLLELRKNNYKLVESHNLLMQRYKDLEQFSSVVSHDIKSPLNNIMMLSKLFKEEYGAALDANGNQMVDYISKSAQELKKLVDGLLEHYKYDAIDVSKREKIRLNDFIKYILELLDIKSGFECILPDEKANFWSNKMALGQILYNIIANAIKYNDKEKGVIEIGFFKNDTHNIISVKDNGMGILKEHIGHIFDIFKTLGKTDRFAQKGTGIGLSTVLKLVNKLDGNIEVDSEPGIGTTFRILLKK
jgi:signal transduction histidine kinase